MKVRDHGAAFSSQTKVFNEILNARKNGYFFG